MMTDINEEALRVQAARITERAGPNRVAYMSLDVTDGDGWGRAVRTCAGLGEKLDICVNNAGTTYKNKVCIRCCGMNWALSPVGHPVSHGGGVWPRVRCQRQEHILFGASSGARHESARRRLDH